MGYTGRVGESAEHATYKSVCGGDGNTEAVRVVFDPDLVTWEDLCAAFLLNPRVPSSIYGRQDPQYQVAIWTHDDQQLAAATVGFLSCSHARTLSSKSDIHHVIVSW